LMFNCINSNYWKSYPTSNESLLYLYQKSVVHTCDSPSVNSSTLIHEVSVALHQDPTVLTTIANIITPKFK
jgi:hypothetical protein